MRGVSAPDQNMYRGGVSGGGGDKSAYGGWSGGAHHTSMPNSNGSKLGPASNTGHGMKSIVPGQPVDSVYNWGERTANDKVKAVQVDTSA